MAEHMITDITDAQNKTATVESVIIFGGMVLTSAQPKEELTSIPRRNNIHIKSRTEAPAW